jgi:hypothetical protein
MLSGRVSGLTTVEATVAELLNSQKGTETMAEATHLHPHFGDVQAHYDLSDEFFRCGWTPPDSGAYFDATT